MSKLLFSLTLTLALSACLIPWGASGQTPDRDKLTVPLTDPSRPAHLKVGLINGSITVNAYSGKDVIVEAAVRSADDQDQEESSDEESAKRRGLRRITNTSTGLSVEEDNNDVEVGVSMIGGSRTVDLTIQVPVSASMRLSTINDGDIHVTGVKGDIEVSNTNGGITLSQISGSAVCDALNGEIRVSFTGVDPKKSMSFSSLNGDIDLTFPPDIKATLKMQTEQGEIYSDFDMKMETSHSKMEENKREREGKYRVTLERMMTGSINGGGQEVLVKNFNGSIYIRKGK